MPTKSKLPKAPPRKTRHTPKPAPAMDTSESMSAPAREPARPFSVGDRVTHSIFGDGVVEAIRDDKMRTKFRKHGTKEIVAGYLKPLKPTR